MTTFHCGRKQMCSPCETLPNQDRSTVCMSVGAVICDLKLDIDNTSLAVIRETLFDQLCFAVDDDDYVSHQMRAAAFASAIELDNLNNK